MTQIVYILTNESFPDFIKIGFTTNLEKRLKTLNGTNLPFPFEVHYAAEVNNARDDEKWMHVIFAGYRLRDGREFFNMTAEMATIALKRIAIQEVIVERKFTPQQEQAVEENKERRSKFDFKTYGIDLGSKLTFTRDDMIVAEVVENNKIKINDKIDSLSSFAMELLGYKNRPQGTLYFKYDGEILDERRRRIDQL
jgi:hypothetical protein